MYPRRMKPSLMSFAATNFAVLMAVAKQMPCAPRITAVFTPITSPRDVTSGPPELPGLSAASVWITLSIRRPDCARSERPSALTTPEVTVHWKPYGLPMAMTSWPGRICCESPERHGHKIGCVDADHGQVGIGIVAYQIGAGSPAVGERDVDMRCAMDDVAVGQNETVGREDEARSAAPRFPTANTVAHFDIHHEGLTLSAAPITARE